jgi:hypothetical protein
MSPHLNPHPLGADFNRSFARRGRRCSLCGSKLPSEILKRSLSRVPLALNTRDYTACGIVLIE